MDVKDIGEFGLIEYLSRMVTETGVNSLAQNASTHLLLGIGDDAAAWYIKDAVVISTTDTVVEGVHFVKGSMPWFDVGWKVMAANLSDIAAMGGSPLYSLVTLGIPEDTRLSHIDDLYQGIIAICKEFNTAIVGGDIVRSSVFFASVALTGVHYGNPLVRSTAMPGDLIAITGFLGLSRGGLECMNRHSSVDKESEDYLKRIHCHPNPRLEEGRILVEEGALCAIDISDGLIADLGKMMLASGVSALVESYRIPIHYTLSRVFPEEAINMALGGGEDYELLYVAPGPTMERTLARIPDAKIIGRVVSGIPGLVSTYDEKGCELRNTGLGWDHFR